MDESGEIFVSGAVSIRACLTGGKREVREVFCAPFKRTGTHAPKDAQIVCELARARGVPVTELTDEIVSASGLKTRASILARVGARKTDDAQKLLQSSSFLACLYGIEDPYNLGDALRTLYAAGCDGVFLPKRDFSSASDILLRASAGASEQIALLEYTDEIADTLVSCGITPVCARQTRASDLSGFTFPSRFCLLIGGEKRGIPKKLDERIPLGVRIDYARGVANALSASAACAAIAFSAVSQRKANR